MDGKKLTDAEIFERIHVTNVYGDGVPLDKHGRPCQRCANRQKCPDHSCDACRFQQGCAVHGRAR